MLSFNNFLFEAFDIHNIKVPEPDIEDDGYEVYTYPTHADVLQVGIGPEEDGSHHIWFTHGGSFERLPSGPNTVAQAKKVLDHVAATIRHHSRKYNAKEYTYEAGNEIRHMLYQRMAKAAKVNATNLSSSRWRKARPAVNPND